MSFDMVAYLHELIDQPGVAVEGITHPSELPREWRIEYEERAAILQFDGGLSREKADSQALEEIIERLKRL